VAAVALVVGSIAALGGFADATTALVPRYELGEIFVGNQTSVTVEGVTLRSAMPDRYATEAEGVSYLVVETTLDSSLDGPNIFEWEVVRVIVDGAIGANDEPESVLDVRTGAQVGPLQPGIPMRVAYVWPIDTGTIAEGDDVIVGIFESYAIADDPLFDDARTRPRGAARVLTSVEGAQ
jgi:hypothetical protein